MELDENFFLKTLSILALKQHHSQFLEQVKSKRLSPLSVWNIFIILTLI